MPTSSTPAVGDLCRPVNSGSILEQEKCGKEREKSEAPNFGFVIRWAQSVVTVSIGILKMLL